MDILNDIKFDDKGLVPTITQDYSTKDVLMLGYMNKEALEKTVSTGRVHYFSRSRNKLWLKGETSGHFQNVKEIKYDCDGDALLILAEQIGGACHTGHNTCFYRSFSNGDTPQKVFNDEDVYATNILHDLYDVIVNRRNNPIEGSYTNYLFDKGIDKILKKVGEENAEVIIAAKNNAKDEVIYEISDLIYHISVLMVGKDITWNDIFKELKKRASK